MKAIGNIYYSIATEAFDEPELDQLLPSDLKQISTASEQQLAFELLSLLLKQHSCYGKSHSVAYLQVHPFFTTSTIYQAKNSTILREICSALNDNHELLLEWFETEEIKQKYTKENCDGLFEIVSFVPFSMQNVIKTPVVSLDVLQRGCDKHDCCCV